MRGAGPRGTVARAAAEAVLGGAPGPDGGGRFGRAGGGPFGGAGAAARTPPDCTAKTATATRVVPTQVGSRWMKRGPRREPLENPDKGASRVTRAPRGGFSRD